MNSMLFAEAAVLVHFKSVRTVLLVLHCVVVALFAFCTSQSDFHSHDGTSRSFSEIILASLKGLCAGRKKISPLYEVKLLYHTMLAKSRGFFNIF